MPIFRFLGAELIIMLAIALFWAGNAMGAERCRGQAGLASWYGHESGNRTASGAPFHPHGLSFAMRSRDFGKVYAVTYRGKTVRAVHNDYGPASFTGRQFDLSEGLAAALGLKPHGVGMVCISRVKG